MVVVLLLHSGQFLPARDFYGDSIGLVVMWLRWQPKERSKGWSWKPKRCLTNRDDDGRGSMCVFACLLCWAKLLKILIGVFLMEHILFQPYVFNWCMGSGLHTILTPGVVPPYFSGLWLQAASKDGLEGLVSWVNGWFWLMGCLDTGLGWPSYRRAKALEKKRRVWPHRDLEVKSVGVVWLSLLVPEPYNIT